MKTSLINLYFVSAGVISTVVPDSPHKIFIGGLPNYLNEDQVSYHCASMYVHIYKKTFIMDLQILVCQIFFIKISYVVKWIGIGVLFTVPCNKRFTRFIDKASKSLRKPTPYLRY